MSASPSLGGNRGTRRDAGRAIALLAMAVIAAGCVPLAPAPPTPPEHSALPPAPLLWADAHAHDRRASVVAHVDVRAALVARR